MSLSVDGVWKADVWANIWADGVWFENATSEIDPAGGGGGWKRARKKKRFEPSKSSDPYAAFAVPRPPVQAMSQIEIQQEMGTLLQKKLRTNEEERAIALLLALLV